MKSYTREYILDLIRSMHYNDRIKFDARIIYDAFPPPPRPTLLEVVVDIEQALNTPKEEFQSSLLPDDSPKTSLDILQKELGDEFIVGQYDPFVYWVVRPVENCPHCHGRGYIAVIDDTPEKYNPLYVSTKNIDCDHAPIIK